MSDQLHIKCCPACSGTDLREGRIGTELHTFVPAGWSFWTLRQGFQARAFVCTTCGFFGHFLTAEDLAKLRAED